MKKILIIIISVILSSCEMYESPTGWCTSYYDIPPWDMTCTPEMKIYPDDIDLRDVDDIRVNIFADNGDITKLCTFEILDSIIILKSNDFYLDSNYSNKVKSRGEIILITMSYN